MSKRNNETGVIHSYVNLSHLDSDVKNLILESVKAMDHAYTPYSNFKVGAAVLCGSGTIYSGCNVENASFGLSICAERTTLVKAISSGDKDFKTIAVCAEGTGDPATPCGACRQFIVEFATNRDIIIYLTNPKMDRIRQTTIYQLLPDHFVLN
uniref:Cytidine deaminase n=1 Tax=Rhodnius prolixus TaxID=13249 RepID=T1HML9_RHOPR